MVIGTTCRRALVVALALAGTALRPATASAADDIGATRSTMLAGVTFTGLVSTSWSYNGNRPSSRTNQYRVFDFDDNSFKLDLVELVAQQTVARPRDAGFRIDVALGGSIPRVSAAAGLFRPDSGSAQDVDVQQAFVSWVAPVESGLRLDIGKFVTLMGYEVIEGYDGWNDNATHSFLFGYAIPFTHVGARANLALTPRVSATAMVVNGWDVARDNNRAKTIGGQLAFVPIPTVTLWLNGMVGPERANTDSDPRSIVEAVAAWKLAPWLTLAADGFRGREPHAALNGGEATWTGVAGYARIAPAGGFALSLRGEIFDDADGARTGAAQRLSEATLTPEWRLTNQALVRADLRVDRSDHDVFEKHSGAADTQGTVLLNVLFSF